MTVEKRTRTKLGPALYVSRTCVHCGNEYTPTSGRQQVCGSDECHAWKMRNYPSRKNGRYVKRGVRPIKKRCEWLDCPVVFAVGPTGLVPRYCDEHIQESVKPAAIAARKQWSRRTLPVPCRFRDCDQLQHPSARGWCHKHYPIWSVHGVDAEKWWEMFEAQQGLCPICHMELFDGGRTIVVDHDHKTAPQTRHTVEHVRGLLHAAPCNGMILGGIETAIANGWWWNVVDYLKTDLSVALVLAPPAHVPPGTHSQPVATPDYPYPAVSSVPLPTCESA